MMDKWPLTTHLTTAHHYWSLHLERGDLVIDATCGNGKDTLLLAKLCDGNLYAIDIQREAIHSARSYLQDNLSPSLFNSVRWIHGCHSTFPEEIVPGSVSLITYNLGYLPGGDKTLTTLPSSTMASLKTACDLLKKGGLISVTCYSGHSEGETEEKRVLEFAQKLDPREWRCCHHNWLNRPKSPTIFILKKIS